MFFWLHQLHGDGYVRLCGCEIAMVLRYTARKMLRAMALMTDC